ncbi:conserved hypothetical protein [Chlorobaculum parvum NCIB 8327]|uniref:Organic solvent tolerance-like N-terminal domain-containing protein n=1 Tax=Chlorobaculum parvum (strain DSM 263 / NCIMB 8327) TaxID=517417 RepID=B3QLC1_CHLP8|nr:conserved hypothetical protein [Chlorobaculum parvum NCIB 8327]
MNNTKRSIVKTAWWLMLPLAVWGTLLTDNTASAGKKKTILEHADFIEGGETSGPSGAVIPYRSAVGNVRFLHGKTILECDRATDWLENERIDLNGHIVIRDNTLETRSDTGTYDTRREIGELSGNVRGRVVEDSLTAKSVRATVDLTGDNLWLFGDAVVWQPGRQLSGDTIRVHLREIDGRKRADELEVRGHAFLATKDTLATSPLTYDQLSARRLLARLDERSRLKNVTATEKAQSLYHLYDEKQQPTGANYTSGAKIRMFFVEGKLSRILTTGNPLGKEYPNSMRESREIDLPGFRLRDKERPVFEPHSDQKGQD